MLNIICILKYILKFIKKKRPWRFSLIKTQTHFWVETHQLRNTALKYSCNSGSNQCIRTVADEILLQWQYAGFFCSFFPLPRLNWGSQYTPPFPSLSHARLGLSSLRFGGGNTQEATAKTLWVTNSIFHIPAIRASVERHEPKCFLCTSRTMSVLALTVCMQRSNFFRRI